MGVTVVDDAPVTSTSPGRSASFSSPLTFQDTVTSDPTVATWGLAKSAEITGASSPGSTSVWKQPPRSASKAANHTIRSGGGARRGTDVTAFVPSRAWSRWCILAPTNARNDIAASSMGRSGVSAFVVNI